MVGPATSLLLSLSANPISCGTTTTIFATVRDAVGNLVPNGTAVQFSTSLGGLGTAFTSGGVAAITLGAPLNFSGSISITATASPGFATNSTFVTVVCTTTVPSQIVLSLGAATACGTSNQLGVTVTDGIGRAVVDGTLVTFSTTVGSITPSAATIGGFATAILSTPSNTAGTALITVNSGGISRQASISISCSAAPTSVPPTAVPQAPSSQIAGIPRLPSAGEAQVTENPLLLYSGSALMLVSLLTFGSSIIPSRRRRDTR